MRLLLFFLLLSVSTQAQRLGIDFLVNSPTGAFAETNNPGIGADLYYTYDLKNDFIKVNIVSFRRFARSSNLEAANAEEVLALPLPLGLAYYYKLSGRFYLAAQAQYLGLTRNDFESDLNLGFSVAHLADNNTTKIEAGYYFSPITKINFVGVSLGAYLFGQ